MNGGIGCQGSCCVGKPWVGESFELALSGPAGSVMSLLVSVCLRAVPLLVLVGVGSRRLVLLLVVLAGVGSRRVLLLLVVLGVSSRRVLLLLVVLLGVDRDGGWGLASSRCRS